MEQYTVTQAAQQTGKAERTIVQLAAAHQIGRRFGRAWVFTAADIARLKAIHKGRPRSPNYKPRARRAAPSPAPAPATAEQGEPTT